MRIRLFTVAICICCLAGFFALTNCNSSRSLVNSQTGSHRERISINTGWKFMRYEGAADTLIYDVRPEVTGRNDNRVADSKPTEAVAVTASRKVLKNWILPAANDFISDIAKHHQRPPGNPGHGFPFVQNNFNDAAWQTVDLPHDWAIKAPFYEGPNSIVGGGMGRLPSHGVAWYRRKIDIADNDTSKYIYLDIDGAMSYAMVWCNGLLVGGWPYGYNSFRLDLTPYVKPGSDNQLAILLDNPPNSSRWYPGGGIYRNVWLTKLNPVHVAHWGTFVRTKNVSASSATIDLSVYVENSSNTGKRIEIVTNIFSIDNKTGRKKFVAAFPAKLTDVLPGKKIRVDNVVTIKNPLLWGPPPSQQTHLFAAVTRLKANGAVVDEYETQFGIRSLQFDPVKGLLVNDEVIKIQGVNQHHDLGALGAVHIPAL